MGLFLRFCDYIRTPCDICHACLIFRSGFISFYILHFRVENFCSPQRSFRKNSTRVASFLERSSSLRYANHFGWQISSNNESYNLCTFYYTFTRIFLMDFRYSPNENNAKYDLVQGKMYLQNSEVIRIMHN